MRSVASVLGLALAAMTPTIVFAQGVADPERAALIEAEAARLHDQPTRWADAVSLYQSAAQLRQHEDPHARRDLFLAANLSYQLGDREGAVTLLESAGIRAISAGDATFATEMFANAAVIADEAGLRDHGRRLRARVADLADVADSQRRGRS